MRIVVIGSGLIGVTSAYFLARHGYRVTVLDRREAAGMETSFANSGMVTPSQADPWNSPASLASLFSLLADRESPLLVKPTELLSLFGWGLVFLRNSTPGRFRRSLASNAALANYSLAVFRQIRAENDIDYDQIQNGTLKLYRTLKAFDKAAALSRSLSSMGVNHEILDRDAVIDREPALAGAAASISGGVYYPDDEAGDAHLFCSEIERLARGLGVEFRFNTRVTGFRTGGDCVEAVYTTAGEIPADVCVLAAGCYSVELGRKLGLSVPIRPIKGYSITMDLNGWQDGPRMPVIDDARHIAATPLGQRLRVAGMAEFAGMDTTVRSDRIDQLGRFVEELYPGFRAYNDVARAGRWAGLRPYCRDGVPLIGRCGYDNLYLNTGHGHLGWSLSAGSGKLLADHIAAAQTEIDISAYDPQRF